MSTKANKKSNKPVVNTAPVVDETPKAPVKDAKDDKLFTVVGTSRLHGKELKMRFANDLKQREGILKYNGHTNISLHQLPFAMNKTDATGYYKAEILPTLTEHADYEAIVELLK